MGFILDGLETESYDRQYSDRALVDRITAYFRPYKGTMILVAAMITLNSAASTAGPILVSMAIDMLAEDPSTTAILLLSLGIGILGASAWVFNFIRQWFSARVTGNVVLKLREDVFKATVSHDLSFYDEHPSGKIVSRVTSDTQDFAEVVNLTLKPAQHGFAYDYADCVAVGDQCAAHNAYDRDDAHCRDHRPKLPARRPDGHPECPAHYSDHQRADPGIHQRNCGRQELPPGTGDLCNLRREQSPGL
jgi:hypothetical protein